MQYPGRPTPGPGQVGIIRHAVEIGSRLGPHPALGGLRPWVGTSTDVSLARRRERLPPDASNTPSPGAARSATELSGIAGRFRYESCRRIGRAFSILQLCGRTPLFCCRGPDSPGQDPASHLATPRRSFDAVTERFRCCHVGTIAKPDNLAARTLLVLGTRRSRSLDRHTRRGKSRRFALSRRKFTAGAVGKHSDRGPWHTSRFLEPRSFGGADGPTRPPQVSDPSGA